MRRLIPALVLAAAILITGCRRGGEIIHPEPTEEGTATLVSVLNMGDPHHAMQLVRGFHHIEENAWRWTMGRFAVTLRTPEGGARKGAKLSAQLSFADQSIARLGPVTLSVRAGQRELGSLTASKAGAYTFEADVPPELLQGRETVTFDFALDKFLPAGTLDGRELGVITSTIGLVSK